MGTERGPRAGSLPWRPFSCPKWKFRCIYHPAGVHLSMAGLAEGHYSSTLKNLDGLSFVVGTPATSSLHRVFRGVQVVKRPHRVSPTSLLRLPTALFEQFAEVNLY